MNSETLLFLYSWTQVFWIAVCVVWALRRKDETPLIISGILFYVFSFRFWAIIEGWTVPVDISPFGFMPMSFEGALFAQGTSVLGESVLLCAYMLTQRNVLAGGKIVASRKVLDWLRPRVFIFAAFAIPISLIARRMTYAQVDAGKVMAFEVSAYLYELPFVLISVSLLLALVWKSGGMPNALHRWGAIGIILIVAYLTFSPTSRFQFLGWVLAVTIIAISGDNWRQRFIKMVTGFGLAMVLFAIAGSMRSEGEEEGGGQSAWQRFAFAEDANMLDGLVMLQEVYPDLLPYDYGKGHLEILERAIPRAWWPDKPMGGYMNRLGLTSIETGFTLGISPGLVGSFYSEGGLIAVVVFGAGYGWLLGRLIRFTGSTSPVGAALIRAITCSALIPLLRGGDLPGIYAWIFMSFWPCFFVLYYWRAELLKVSFKKRKIVPARYHPAPSISTSPLQEL